jgi:hypothetical protein
LLFFVVVASKLALALLVIAGLGYLGRRRAAGKPTDWPFTIAILCLPVSAGAILLTARPTRRSAVLDSNFLALEGGCWALLASFVVVWTIAWLALRRRRQTPSLWKRALVITSGLAAALVMISLLPLEGTPDLHDFFTFFR